MLSLPKRVTRSITVHRSKLSVFCDWLEATVLFKNEDYSQTDVIDFLIEQQTYDSQDFCEEFVTSAWREFRRRMGWLKAHSPIEFRDRRVIRKSNWQEQPAHAFCLLLGLKPFYSDWQDHFGDNHLEQGLLFEKLVEQSLDAIFQDWTVVRTGWSTDEPTKIAQVVSQLASDVVEDEGNIEKYAGKNANEEGLDAYWYFRFNDERGGYPVFLAQCASGDDWKDKLHTPNLSVWAKLVDWKSPPARAFAMPFALEDGEFNDQCNRFSGLFLDRYRILQASRKNENWLEEKLAKELVAWLAPRIQWVANLN